MQQATVQESDSHCWPNGFQLFMGSFSLASIVLKSCADCFNDFSASWNNLGKDNYLFDSGTYRKRRYSVFRCNNEELGRLPHEAHFQDRSYNQVHGGINRIFLQWDRHIDRNVSFITLLKWISRQLPESYFGWRIQAHQFRVFTNGARPGKPTPEGIHKDGADCIFIMLIDKKNIQGGVNNIYNNQCEVIEQVLLSKPGDALLLHDQSVYHSVSPIYAINHKSTGYRDTLVLTFHKLLN